MLSTAPVPEHASCDHPTATLSLIQYLYPGQPHFQAGKTEAQRSGNFKYLFFISEFLIPLGAV